MEHKICPTVESIIREKVLEEIKRNYTLVPKVHHLKLGHVYKNTENERIVIIYYDSGYYVYNIDKNKQFRISFYGLFKTYTIKDNVVSVEYN